MELANKSAIFMHCLPSFHDTNTTVGKSISEKFNVSEMEVTNEVFESNNRSFLTRPKIECTRLKPLCMPL